MINNLVLENSSFKDPDAAVFICNGEIYRKINYQYKESYDHLMSSGLYQFLIEKKLLVNHVEVENKDDTAYKTIKPEKVFISYPWEWSFSQLKDAALTTLKIQKIALEYGMSLKDANCYNIQFGSGKPVFIDTSSFEKYINGQPWTAYKQFCENFLAPLLLMSLKDIRLNSLLTTNINGIPLDLVSKLLPFSTFFNLKVLMHIHLHAKMQNVIGSNHKKKFSIKVEKYSQIAIINDLISLIKKLKLRDYRTEWVNYYNFTNYKEESFEHKKKIILEYKNLVNPAKVWDFGANTGEFSRLFKNCAGEIVSLDIDPLAIEENYLRAKEENNILPLVFDLTNPSPAVGWDNCERLTLVQRAENVDLVMALALIHHLRITYNIPFYKMCNYFSKIAPYLIIEFVNKNDSQIKKMLLNRKDIFDDYSIENFEQEFSKVYEIKNKTVIKNTNRIMYLMRKHS